MTAYGCCPDGVTAATGPAEEGCDIFIVDPQPKPDIDTDITVGGQDGRDVSGIVLICSQFAWSDNIEQYNMIDIFSQDDDPVIETVCA